MIHFTIMTIKIINHYAFSSSIEPSDVNGYSGCLPDWSSSPSLVTSVMSIFSQCPFQSCSTTTNDAYVKLDFLFYTQYIAQIQFKSGVGFPSIFTYENKSTALWHLALFPLLLMSRAPRSNEDSLCIGNVLVPIIVQTLCKYCEEEM